MAEYHVGCGIAGIYAGTLTHSGKNWKNKSDVTQEALAAVAEHLACFKSEFRFTYDGQQYVLKVEKDGEHHDSN